MLKRTFALFTVVLLLMGTLSATAQGSVVELVFHGWGNDSEVAVFSSLVDQFNAANDDVRIIYEHIPGDYVGALTTNIAGSIPPDIAYIPDGNFSAFVSRGQLVSLQEFLDASEVITEDNIWPSALGRYRWDAENTMIGTGDVYALPKDIGPTVLYINEDLFESMGVPLPDPTVPMTWDQLIETARALTVDSNGNHPGDAGFDRGSVQTFGLGELWYENVVYGNGGRLVSEDGRTFVGSSDMNTIDALQFISDLNHVYQLTPTQQQTASMSIGQMFETGRVGMTTNGRWAVTFYRDVLDFNWSVRPNIVGPSGTVTSYGNQEDCSFSGWSGSVGIAIISQRSENGVPTHDNAAEAYRFIEFLAGPEGQTAATELGFQIPNQVDIALSDVFLQPDMNPDNAEVYLEAARCEMPGPWTQTPLFGQWFDPNFWGGVWQEAVVEGSVLVEDAFADRADAFQIGLDEAWATIQGQ